MKKLILLLIMLFCLFCKTEQKNQPIPPIKVEKVDKPVEKVVEKPKSDPTKANNWSDNQGRMNWYEAKEKCGSIGMRLPTREDFRKATKFGVTKKWNTLITKSVKENDFATYWTSDEVDDSSAYKFSLMWGKASENSGTWLKENDPITDSQSYVRCIR